jgi:hypothetical protein
MRYAQHCHARVGCAHVTRVLQCMRTAHYAEIWANPAHHPARIPCFICPAYPTQMLCTCRAGHSRSKRVTFKQTRDIREANACVTYAKQRRHAARVSRERCAHPACSHDKDGKWCVDIASAHCLYSPTVIILKKLECGGCIFTDHENRFEGGLQNTLMLT